MIRPTISFRSPPLPAFALRCNKHRLSLASTVNNRRHRHITISPPPSTTPPPSRSTPHPNSIMPPTNPPDLTDFLTALQHVYGPITTIPFTSTSTWTPPPLSDGHLGRYLWTDAFGVLNLLTLHRHLDTPTNPHYLHLASRLITTVHQILGRTRDQSSLLPGASESHPLSGGLRIGKPAATGNDGDGQYHHYITLWMFALNRYSLAANDGGRCNSLAIELGRGVHSAFLVGGEQERPRMRWKMSVDLKTPLVATEGRLDPFDGYVVYSLVHNSRQLGEEGLQREVEEYKKIVDAKRGSYDSEDPLDLGMTLWTCHWSNEEWARVMKEGAVTALKDLYESHELDIDPGHRLAFREFGSVLGIKCWDELWAQDYWKFWVGKVMGLWRDVGQVPTPTGEMATLPRLQKLAPITLVMFCAAMEPGGRFNGIVENWADEMKPLKRGSFRECEMVSVRVYRRANRNILDVIRTFTSI